MPDEFDKLYTPETLIELGKMSLKLAADPKTRRKHLENVKAIDPNFREPADVQIERLKEETTREREEREIAAAAARSIARQESERQKLIDSGRYTADQVKEIETSIMQKHGLADYDAAAKIYAADLKPAKPTGSDRPRHGATWTFPDMPGLLEDPAKAAQDAAYSIIDEFRKAG